MKENEFKVHNLSDIIPDGTQLAQANMFYCGDWAYVKKIGKKGLVKETHIGEYEQLVTLLMEDGTMLKVRSNECDFTTPDPKAAFLTELQALLKRYNAYIFPCGYEVDGLSIVINDKDEIHYDMYEWSTMHDLSADNIFNYDKE